MLSKQNGILFFFLGCIVSLASVEGISADAYADAYESGTFSSRYRESNTAESQDYRNCGDLTRYYDANRFGMNEADFKGCWYLGAGLSFSNLSPNSDGSEIYTDTTDASTQGYNLLIGKQLSSVWFLEGMYASLGEATFTNIFAPETNQNEATIDYSALGLSLGYSFRNVGTVRPFMKTGVVSMLTSENGFASNVDITEDGDFLLSLGFGAHWRPQYSPWFLRVEYSYFSQDVQAFNLSIQRDISFKEANPQNELLDGAGGNRPDFYEQSNPLGIDVPEMQQYEPELVEQMTEAMSEGLDENAEFFAPPIETLEDIEALEYEEDDGGYIITEQEIFE